MKDLCEIKLYGFLADKYGKKLNIYVASVTEAIRALCANFPELKRDIYNNKFYIFVDNVNIDITEVADIIGGNSIKIVPIIGGSGGFFRVLVGVALIGLSFVPGFQGVALLASGLRAVGTSLLFGGISEIFFSPNDSPVTGFEPAENRPNFAFQGSVNTITQGGAVPLCYGRVITGSAVISAGISTSQN